MRTTVDLEPQLHARVRRRAQREGISLGRMLGKLVEQGLQGVPANNEPPAMQRSGRFTVLVPATPDAKVASAAIQQIIDDEGIL